MTLQQAAAKMVQAGFPAKPALGAPCNGCGLCCAVALCEAATLANLKGPPCEALRVMSHDGRKESSCALVVAEREHGMVPLVATMLGIGAGCGMDDLEQEEPAS